MLSLGAVLGVFLAFTSLFLFDAPGSEKNPATIVLFFSAVTLPVACLASIALSWILYLRRRFTGARVISMLPLLNLLTGALALIYLELFCGGRFSG